MIHNGKNIYIKYIPVQYIHVQYKAIKYIHVQYTPVKYIRKNTYLYIT